MKTIYKYPLKIMDHNTVEMPVGARILCVQMQSDQLCLWALVDVAHREQESRHFRIFATGQPIEVWMGQNYIGTVQTGILVWHIFEVK